MANYLLNKLLTAEQLGKIFDESFAKELGDMLRSFELDEDQITELSSEFGKSAAFLIPESNYVGGDSREAELFALKSYMERIGVFNSIRLLRAHQSRSGFLDIQPLEKTDKDQLAEEFYTKKNLVILTRSNRAIFALACSDQMASGHELISQITGIDSRLFLNKSPNLEVMQNVFLIAEAKVNGLDYMATAVRHLAPSIASMLIENGRITPGMRGSIVRNLQMKAEEKASAGLSITATRAVNDAIVECRRFYREDKIQLFADARFYGGFVGGPQLNQLGAGISRMAESAHLGLRQSYALAQSGFRRETCGLTVFCADLVRTEGRREAERIITSNEELRTYAERHPDEMVRKILGVTKAGFDRPEVEKIIEALNLADDETLLWDPSETVPFMRKFCETGLPSPIVTAPILDNLNDIFSCRKSQEDIRQFLGSVPKKVLKEAIPYALAIRYLEVVQNLMPDEFEYMKPPRGPDTDGRLIDLKSRAAIHVFNMGGGARN